MSRSAHDEVVAFVGLLKSRPQRKSWPEIAADVALAGSATAVWNEAASADALLPDAAMAEELVKAREVVARWQEQELWPVTVLDDTYPERLRDIRESPPFLFVSGELKSEDVGMSVVGSRGATPEGQRAARAASELLVEHGLTVISGLAAGVDSVAHRAALDAGGRTVAVLGTGITRAYPASSRDLQEEIAQRGLLISQFWPDAPPTRQSFPMRNATMSGYGLATIVVEAGEHSGTRIQARLAVEHGRPVVLTDTVASGTKWGAELVGRPGVHVVGGIKDLRRVVGQILAERDALGEALRVFMTSAA